MFAVFYFLIILAAAFLWLCLSGAYKPLGKLVHRIWKDAKDNMQDESDLTNDKKETNEND